MTERSSKNEVALILDSGFGDRLFEVARNMPTWICESAGNNPVVDELWKARRRTGGQGNAEGLRYVVTRLDDLPNETETERLKRGLSHVVEHHGPLSGFPFPEIHLFGLTAEAFPRELLAEFSLLEVIEENDHLVLRQSQR